MRRRPYINYESQSLVAYYDLMESIGDYVTEYVTASSVFISERVSWSALPEKLPNCEYDTKYSSRGYCQCKI